MSIEDSAVGAILEIPPQALRGIENAEKAIWSLHDASKKAADQIYGDFSKRMPMGVDVFIQKLAEAKKAMDNLGTINVTLNTNAAVQSTEQLSAATQKTSQDVSKAAQDMASSWNDLSKVKLGDSTLSDYGKNLTEVLTKLSSLKHSLKNDLFAEGNKQALANEIRQIEEMIRLYKLSADEKNKALGNIQQKQQAQVDKAYLDEQKRLLADILTIRKQINANEISKSRKIETGGNYAEEKRNLEDLNAKLKTLENAYVSLQEKKGKSLSEQGQKDAENNQLRYELSLLKEMNSAREKLNQNISRGNELANQAKLKSAGLGSTDDSIYQRTLTGLYQDQIKVIKEIGKVRADIASEGRRASESEVEKLTLLAQKYRELQTAINNTSGKYSKIDTNVQSNFEAERSRQIVENTVLKEQAERKYQETLAKTQQILAGKIDLSSTLESLSRFRQEEERLRNNLERIQNLIQQLKQERIDIQFNLKADAQEKIAPLIERLRELRQLTKQPFGTDKLKEYYREIDIIKEKIKEANIVAQSQSANNPALLNNQEQIDALVRRYNALAEELGKVGIEANKVGQALAQQQESNSVIEAQAQRVQVLEQRLQNLNAIWERLKATNQAYDSNGNLSDKSKRLIAIQDEVKNEIMLRRMTASEAQKYEEKKTADAKREADKRIADAKREADKRIADAKREAKAIKEAQKAQRQQNLSTPQGAIDHAKNARNLRELTDAYENLKKVMASTDPKSQKWADMNSQLQNTKQSIDDIKKKMGEFRSESSKASGTVGQLQRRIAAAFSVGAISGFIKRMIDVRAQFELQRVALGAILQDRDKADRIFLDVQQMALQSPFSIMQLERATKQIAAFGFEAEQLKPTLKMLADMSAGLGVEIDRLVLVMGHLKARNYLEGTMVRQFTNAGFNVLGELSKYYTELEGKMVSVADVQERVKKKMVSFGDVEEVLKRVTSAGGMFYDMQKKQSDSLFGQLQRITDAADIMFNEIGRSNQGIISFFLSTIRKMIANWRTFVPIIKAAGVALLAFWLRAKVIHSIITWCKNLGNSFKSLVGFIRQADASTKALGATLKTAFSGTVIGTIGAIVGAIWGLLSSTSVLEDEFENIHETVARELDDMTNLYVHLARVISSTTASQKEKNDAMEEMHRVFSKILPQQYLENEYITQAAGNYAEATKQLRIYYQTLEYEKSNAAVIAERDKATNKKIKDWADTVYGELKDEFKSIISKQDLEQLMRYWVEQFSHLPKDEFSKALKQKFIDYTGSDNPFISDMYFDLRFSERARGNIDVTDILDTYNKYNDKVYEVIDTTDIAATAVEKSVARQKVAQENAQKDIAEYVERYKQLIMAYVNKRNELAKRPENFGKTNEELRQSSEALNGLYTDAIRAFEALGMPIPTDGLDEATSNIYKVGDAMQWISDNATPNLSKSFIDISDLSSLAAKSIFDLCSELLNVNDAIKLFGANKETKQMPLVLDPNKIENNVREVWERIGNKYGKDFVDLFTSDEKFLKDDMDNIAKYTKKLKEEYEARQEIIDKYNRYETEESKQAFLNRENISKQTLEQYKKYQPALKATILEFDPTIFDKKGGGRGEDEGLKRWQNVKKAIEDTVKAYEEYRKSFSKSQADKTIYEQYGKVFKNLGVNISDYFKDGVFDAKALINALKILKEQLANTSSARAKAINDIMLEIEGKGIELDVKLAKDAKEKAKAEIDEMFANYDLTKELAEAGLDIKLAFVVGGEPMTLQQLKGQLLKQFAALGGKYASKDDVKMYEDAFKKIEELEYKSQKERLKNLHKFTLEAVSDRMRIEMKAQEEINKIQQSDDMNDLTKNLATESVLKKKQEDLDKLAWDTFKSSDLYLDFFENIEHASKESIDFMISKIESLKDSLKHLPADQVRAIVKELDNLKERSAKLSNPFGLIIKNAIPAIKAIRNAKKAQKQLNQEQKSLDSAKSEQERYRDLTVTLGEKLSIAKKDKSVSKEQVALLEKQLQDAGIQLEIWNGIVDRQKGTVKSLKQQIAEADGLTEKMSIGFGGASAIFGQISQSISQIKDDWAQIFGPQSDEFNDTLDTISDVTGALSELTAGVETIMKGDVVGGVIQTVTGLFSTIASFFAIGDKKKERQIKKLKESVEDLDRTYQRLEKSMEKAYTFDAYNADYEKMRKNLAQQQADYEDMLALEKSKKNYDKEAIKEYEDKLNELADKQAELRKERLEVMGSTEDYLSEAQSFVDAWLDAYREVGDGTDALKESWDDFIDNLAVKQAASAILSAQMKNVIARINTAIDEGKTGLDLSEAVKKATSEFKDKAGIINEGLKEFFDAMGVSLSKGELTLSDLQKGIQNITEPQAAAIEAYLNSMRFAVFDQNTKLDTLIATIQMQYGNGVENPIVTELKGVRNAVENIERMLGKVIVSPSQNNTSSGYAIKVR